MNIYRGTHETRFHKKLKVFKIETLHHIVYYIKNQYEDDYFPFWEDKGKVVYSGMSGCMDIQTKYQRYHITMSGYTQSPYFGKKEEIWIFLKEEITKEYLKWEKTDLNENFLYLLAVKFPFQLVPVVTEYSEFEIPPETREVLYPIIRTYESSKVIPLRHKETEICYIHHIPRSFNSTVIFGQQEIFTIPKVRIQKDYSDDLYTIYTAGKNRKIVVGQMEERKSIYILVHPEYNFKRIFGWEQFKDHLHPRCEISSSFIEEYGWGILFNNRIGDLLFIQPEESSKNGKNGKIEFSNIEEFKEIKKEDERLKKVEIAEIGEKFILFHSEHGYLHLPKQKYEIISVPYVRAGHD